MKNKVQISHKKINLVSLLLTIIIVSAIGIEIQGFLKAATPNMYRAQPQQMFFWGRSAPRLPFSNTELQAIASNYKVVVFNSGVANFDLSAQEQQARTLKAMNPNIKLLFYFNTKHYLAESRHPLYMTGFDLNTMALHDAQGNVLTFKATADLVDGLGYYVDESAPAWHKFFLDTSAAIMTAGNFDGIAMDSFRPLNASFDADAYNALTPARRSAWDNGQLQLLQEFKTRFPSKFELYNGISQVVKNQVNRDLGPLATADATINEGFCLEASAPNSADIINDINLMNAQAPAHKTILQKTLYDPTKVTAAKLQQYGNFCFGGFMMGYHPGYDYFNFSQSYDPGQLATTPSEANLDLGAPKGNYSLSGQLAHRSFQNGEVYVNFGTSPLSTTLGSAMTRMQNGSATTDYASGSKVVVGPQEAAFMIYDSVLATKPLTQPAAPVTAVVKTKTNTTTGSGAGATEGTDAANAASTQTNATTRLSTQKPVSTNKLETILRTGDKKKVTLILAPVVLILSGAVFLVVRRLLRIRYHHEARPDVVSMPPVIVTPTVVHPDDSHINSPPTN